MEAGGSILFYLIYFPKIKLRVFEYKTKIFKIKKNLLSNQQRKKYIINCRGLSD